MTALTAIADLPRLRREGHRPGITSVCSSHPVVIEAALMQGIADDAPVLIEATCNQVNQDGGYTGMSPAAFRAFAENIAGQAGFDPGRLILGGDHLGPNPWKHLPAEEALNKAEAMIDAFARAGFSKLHLDTSMGCLGEPAALPDDATASRAARLAAVAERAAGETGRAPPIYIIGTEVPTPGGALEALDHLSVTRPEAALETIEIHKAAFKAAGLAQVFDRVVGIVVQPGVEFGNAEVIPYRPEAAKSLSAILEKEPQFIFEAHSTDYQPARCLRALVDGGFAILKVGPGVTFALREALYGLDHIADAVDRQPGRLQLQSAMEKLMLSEPANWSRYYEGSESERFAQRHFSYSDRIRYYWPHPVAREAVDRLLERFGEAAIPETLVSQYLPRCYESVRDGHIKATPHALLIASVRAALEPYSAACAG